MIGERREGPTDGVLSALLHREVDGRRLDDEEVVAHIRMFFAAGAGGGGGGGIMIIIIIINPVLSGNCRGTPLILRNGGFGCTKPGATEHI